MPPLSPRILVSVTSRIAVLYAIPLHYTHYPRLSTLSVSKSEANALNEVVQIYAGEALFYRSERPLLNDNFISGQYKQFRSSQNIVEMIVHDMPGVQPRDPAIDALERIFNGDQ